ncbi:hypothetical protein Q7P37_003915 [Cladosporium fusiforme]
MRSATMGAGQGELEEGGYGAAIASKTSRGGELPGAREGGEETARRVSIGQAGFGASVREGSKTLSAKVPGSMYRLPWDTTGSSGSGRALAAGHERQGERASDFLLKPSPKIPNFNPSAPFVEPNAGNPPAISGLKVKSSSSASSRRMIVHSCTLPLEEISLKSPPILPLGLVSFTGGPDMSVSSCLSQALPPRSPVVYNTVMAVKESAPHVATLRITSYRSDRCLSAVCLPAVRASSQAACHLNSSLTSISSSSSSSSIIIIIFTTATTTTIFSSPASASTHAGVSQLTRPSRVCMRAAAVRASASALLPDSRQTGDNRLLPCMWSGPFRFSRLGRPFLTLVYVQQPGPAGIAFPINRATRHHARAHSSLHSRISRIALFHALTAFHTNLHLHYLASRSQYDRPSIHLPCLSSLLSTDAAHMAAGSPTSAVSARTAARTAIPSLYRLFFLYIEPVATAVGAYYAALDQQAYMHLTLPPNGTAVSTRESIVLYQLANLYFVFALNEALVLRATADLRVWSVFLLGLLLADFGHLASVAPVGWEVYYRFWDWNSMYWGNLGFVYVGAAMRSCFLLRIGFAGASPSKATKSKR